MQQILLIALVWLVVSRDLDGAEITFHRTIETARKAGEGSQQIVVVFGAEWCGWCRRMEADTFAHPKVAAVASKYTWVKIDIDEQKDVAARFRVRGVPATVLLGPDDRVLASRPGYMPPDKFLEFLTADHSKRKPPERNPAGPEEGDLAKRPRGPLAEDPDQTDDLIAELREGRGDAVRDMVDALARADRANRKRILAALADAGKTPWPVLFELMHDDRLAVRAAAASALDHATHSGLPFHPFAPPPRRDEQIIAWKTWLESRGVTADPPSAVAEIPIAAPADAPAEAELPAEMP